jgi:hypothetical protein
MTLAEMIRLATALGDLFRRVGDWGDEEAAWTAALSVITRAHGPTIAGLDRDAVRHSFLDAYRRESPPWTRT